MKFYITFITALGAVNSIADAIITANIDSALCQGEQLVLTCIDQGTSQRWAVHHKSGSTFYHSFARKDHNGTQYVRYPNQYTFTLISNNFNNFESTFSTVSFESLMRVECTGSTSSASFPIRIAGHPGSPINVDSVVTDYYENLTTVLISWDPPNDNTRVDYYQYTVMLFDEPLETYNVTNTSQTLSKVSYNENITIVTTAFNCVGESSPVIYTFNIVGCSVPNNSLYDVHKSAFSQAPGTVLMFSCDQVLDANINITCQDDGRWEPNPYDLINMCDEGPSVSTTNQITEKVTYYNFLHTDKTSESNHTVDTSTNPSLLPVYIVSAIVTAGLCLIIGFVAICMLRKRMKAKQVIPPLYNEVIDAEPIYETLTDTNNDKYNAEIQMEVSDSNIDDGGAMARPHAISDTALEVTLLNNGAYSTCNTKFNVQTNANEAYQVITSLSKNEELKKTVQNTKM